MTREFANDLVTRIHAAHRQAHGRMTDVPAFLVPATDAYLAAVDTNDEDRVSMAEPALVEDVTAGLPEGARVEVVAADCGRGASGYGAAVELLGVVSDVGGAIAFTAGACKLVKAAYDAISRRLGSAPCVSLGSARFLAAADLVQRLGAEDVSFVGAGDLSDAPPDFSYTGFDNFWVAIRHEDRLYSWVVDAVGKAHFVGSVGFVPTGPLGWRTVAPEGASEDGRADRPTGVSKSPP